MPTPVHAPAKINFYLHITGRRDNGYHELDSLMGFINPGDTLDILPSDRFSFHVRGPFARGFTAQDLESGRTSGNLVVRAVYALADHCGRVPDFRVTLTKNLPLGSGLGGGSADAAAMIRALLDLWSVTPDPAWLDPLLLKLGAEMPFCFYNRAARVQGIGEHVTPLQKPLPPLSMVVINPLQHCPTPAVFASYARENAGFDKPIGTLPDFENSDHFIDWLREHTGNSLYNAARRHAPAMEAVLSACTALPECRLARMSGSGASIFALFDDTDTALHAAEKLTNPAWWVRVA